MAGESGRIREQQENRVFSAASKAKGRMLFCEWKLNIEDNRQ
jgi:hypothetical protein